MPPCPELGQSLASEAMKQLLLICAVVALVGCGESAEEKAAKAKAAAADWKVIEKAIREELKKPTGGLTEADLEKVKSLRLSNKQLTSVKGLENLTQLTLLDLTANKLTDVKGLEKLTQLKELRLERNQLTDVKSLEKLTQLELLWLHDNPALTKAQIDELDKALPNCRILHPKARVF